MASCITTKWGNDYSPQCQLTVTQKSATDTTVTLSWTLAYVTNGYAANTNGVGRSYSVKINGTTVKSGTYNINGLGGSNTRTIASGTTTVNKGTAAKSVSFSCSFYFDVTWGGTYSGTRTASGSISIAAKTSYTVGFNANGGTGAPSAQTKWYGTALTLSSTKPTRTGYTFKGWGTSASATSAKYSAGGSYTANASATLYAVWSINTWKVTYYANGGTGAPSAQTKKYGTALTLSGVEPTRDGYEFVGWGTSASATAAAYQPGASYTSNAALNLYAVWKVAYWTPKVTSLKALRCDASGNLDADGTYALVSFRWEVCTDSGSFSLKAATVTCNGKTTNAAIEYDDGTTVKGSGSAIVGAGALSVDQTYSATVKVTDSSTNSPNYTEATKTVSTAKFLMDMLAGGGGLAFGRAARYEGYVESLFHLLMEPSKSIQGTYNGTNYNQFQPINANGNCVLGYGMYNAGVGATNLYGNSFSITSKSAPLINGRAYGENKVLWEAVSYLKSDQTAELDEAISAQPHGVVLVFSSYDVATSTANNYNWHQVFIPKYLASNDLSGGYNVMLTQGGMIYHKFLYVHDTQIAGYSTNNSSSFSMAGQTVDNRKFVLRKVIGV